MTLISTLKSTAFKAQVSRAKSDGTVSQKELQALRNQLASQPPAARAASQAWLQRTDPKLAEALKTNANLYVPGSGSTYQDESAGKAVESLKAQKQPISGAAMEKAIKNATADLDGQAAGKEFNDLKKFADQNWDKLSPDAKEKFRVYEKFAGQAQARGQTGIPQGEYNKMLGEMKTAGYKDGSSGAAIDGLKSGPKPISGDAMMDAIQRGTADTNNQAAGKEFADFKKFAQENWKDLSPEARAKFGVYEKYASASQAKGQTGIPQNQWNKMMGEMKVAGYQDAGSGGAIEDLKKQPQPISGAAMEQAIKKGTADLDGQAAGKEFADFKKYAFENWDKLSPDAKAKFSVYEKYANAARAQGQTGIAQGEYKKMLGEMKTAGYKDQSAGSAIEDLKRQPQPISGEAMQKAIFEGTKDLDGQAAGSEFAEFKKFATQNWDKLSPDAKAKFGLYEQYATAAQQQGQTGIDTASYARMMSQMNRTGYQDGSAGNAIETLKKQPQPVSGAAMEDAIKNATADLDNQAAGKEYADLKKYATENWDKLSPDAKAKFGVYEKYAQAAQAKGQTGIPVGEYNKMLAEMKTTGYKDSGAGAAIEGLKNGPQPVSGAAMEAAIAKGTADLDAQAAGKEFADFKKYATENWDKLSPDAKAKFGVYEKYAQAAQAKGQTGIPVAEYNKMLAEMKTTGYKDSGAGAAIEGLKNGPQPVSGAAMEAAIAKGTADLDAQAAGKEFADFKKYATENWDKLSPDAKEKFRVYEKYAQAAQAKGQTGIPVGEYNKMLGEMKTAGYKDTTSGAAVESLKGQKAPISGDAMEAAIRNGTADLDAQAAGKEFADFKKYATENWDKLSPEAKAKFGIYEKYAQAAQAKGQTGIPQGEYDKMFREMKGVGYKDASAGAAIEDLKKQPQPVSGAAMDKAIRDATMDLDGQAAGKEYADLKKYATENWDKLSPDAKAKFGVYEKYAQAAQAKGQTGIPVGQYNKMLAEMKTAGYQDQSAGAAIEGLKQQPKPVSGAAMDKAILSATEDLDGQAAGKEFADLKKYATENWSSLSPDAKAKFRVYEKFVNEAKAKGQTGIDLRDYARMRGEMSRAGYKDASVGQAMESLRDTAGRRIDGAEFQRALLAGTKDLDGQAAGREYADVKKFVTENWDTMTPAARRKFEVYEKYAQAAQARGQTGISQADYDRMTREMSRIRD